MTRGGRISPAKRAKYNLISKLVVLYLGALSCLGVRHGDLLVDGPNANMKYENEDYTAIKVMYEWKVSFVLLIAGTLKLSSC